MIVRPADVAALKEALQVAASRKQQLTVDRRELVFVDAITDHSMTVRVGAGLRLDQLEIVAGVAGLSLGALPPEVKALTLAEAVEGTWRGMRAVVGGRLEPMCSAVELITGDGHIISTHAGPRHAAGIDLSSLVCGGHGHSALLTSATVRLELVPESEVVVHVEVRERAKMAQWLRDTMSAGVRLDWARVHDGGLDVALSGSYRLVAAWMSFIGGLKTDRQPSTDELLLAEAAWPEIERRIETDDTLELWRPSLVSCVIRSERPAEHQASRSPLFTMLKHAADSAGVLGSPSP